MAQYNNLNQILIEGTLYSDPSVKNKKTLISIESTRYFNGAEKETCHFDIYAEGELGKNCLAELKKGRGVRVIGRLTKSREQNSLYTFIVADHVIFKPEIKVSKAS